MKKAIFTSLAFFIFLTTPAQNTQETSVTKNNATARPKLVVGIVVDQMRWDYLYRYYNRYAPDGGFRRLLNEGFSCENTFISYTPTITACGHAGIYTGSVPAIHGITGNDWWDYNQNKFVYCTGDDNEKTIGSNTALGQMSPRNMMVTTISDELRLATNFESKVIGVAIKDRGAILPAGHSANGAYWYDSKTGDIISSSYYRKDLPKWVKDFNEKKLVDKYYEQDWNLLYPLNTYTQSAASASKKFTHPLKQYVEKNYGIIAATPHGNTFTFEMAMAALTAENLGADSVTDMLTVSLSSPDYIGHAYGPNSVEAEDCFLKLDKDLGNFLRFLDAKTGKGEYLVFLTADHGAANAPAFLKDHNIPAGNFESERIMEEINTLLKEKTKKDHLIIGILNYQIYLDRDSIKAAGLNKDSLINLVTDYLIKQPGISRAFNLNALSTTTLNAKQKEAFTNGFYPSRCGDIQIVFQPQWIDEFLRGGTTHGVWNPYDSHIPLLWYGWKIRQGATNRETYMTDIASTLAALLHIQMPGGAIGNVIEEVK